ncbi:MAG: hypothetical protein WCQ54_07805 [Clostridiaceae bacterium]
MDKELIEMISNLLDKKLDPIKKDISGIKEDVSVLKEDVSGLKEDVSGLKKDVKYIKVQQEEQGRILRILVDKAETNRADHDAMSNSIIQLSGKVENMRKDMAALEIVSARNMEYIAALKLLK